MSRILVTLVLVLLTACVPTSWAATPVSLTMHQAESGASANGRTPTVLGFDVVTVQNVLAAAWDGTLTFEGSVDGTTFSGVMCRNVATNAQATTLAAANGVVSCPISGLQNFRARISGRTVGSTTTTATLHTPSASLSTASSGAITGTGTANRLARWTGVSTLGNSLLSDDATNVTLTSGNLIVPSASFIGLGSAAGRLVFTDAATDTIALMSANLGIGTTAVTHALTIGKDFAINDGIKLLDSDGGFFSVEQSTSTAGAFQPIFKGFATGNVSSLIFGGLRSTTATDGVAGTKTMRFYVRESDDIAAIGNNDIAFSFDNSSTALITVLGSGNVGINQTNPTHLLDLALGTLTAQKAGINLIGTWNNAGVTFSAITANITDTTSASGSQLMALQVGSSDVVAFRKGGLGSTAPQSATCADVPGAGLGVLTLTPTSSVVNLTNSDSNGCDVTMGETGMPAGAIVRIVVISNAGGTVNFSDSAAVSELAGAFNAAITGTISLVYTNSSYYEVARSNN